MLSLLFPLCFFSIVGVLACLSFCVFSDGKGSGGWNRTNRNGMPTNRGSYCVPPGFGSKPCSHRAARKGRPSLRSNSPVFPWARSYRLPNRVAYFVPVCKRAKIGLLLSWLYHPSFIRRGEFLSLYRSLLLYCSGAGSFPIGSSSPRCILLTALTE